MKWKRIQNIRIVKMLIRNLLLHFISLSNDSDQLRISSSVGLVRTGKANKITVSQPGHGDDVECLRYVVAVITIEIVLDRRQLNIIFFCFGRVFHR